MITLLLLSPALAGADVDPRLRVELPAPPTLGALPRSSTTLSVTLQATEELSPADVARLEALGASFHRRADSQVRHVGPHYTVDVPRDRIAQLAADPAIRRLEPTLPPPPMPPTAVTGEDVGAQALWNRGPTAASRLDGTGVTILDIDVGVDVFHPAFFHADAGAYPWLDVDGDGWFDPDEDAVDLDGDGEVSAGEDLTWFDSWAYYFDADRWEYVYDFNDGDYDVDLDWIYLDQDDDGERDYGPWAGFDEGDPSYGDPFLVPDDANHNGLLDQDERLLMLGTSKIARVREGGRDYVRGEDLIEYPTTDFDSASHGTGVAGILGGGQNPGRRHLVGLAPEAELVVWSYADTNDESMVDAMDWGLEQGARVFLHEWAPWIGYHMDGSSSHEQAMDEAAADGVVQASPAGNLADADKRTAGTVPAGGTESFGLYVPAHYPYLVLDLKWLDPDVDLTATLVDPDGQRVEVDWGGYLDEDWSGVRAWADRWDSSRGTALGETMIWQESGQGLPVGAWKLEVHNEANHAVDVVILLADYLSGWGQGISFDEPDPSGTLCANATADSAIAVAAYAGRHADWDGVQPGELRTWSSRGPRIDGERDLDVAAPDDPFAPVPAIDWGTSAEGYYGAFGGTSGAGPHVAAVAALMLQASPDLDGLDVRERLREAADWEAGMGTSDWGAGRLDGYEAVTHSEDRPDPQTVSVELQLDFHSLPTGECAVGAHLSAEVDEPWARFDYDYDGVWDTPWRSGQVGAWLAEPGEALALRFDVADGGNLVGGGAWSGTAPDDCQLPLHDPGGRFGVCAATPGTSPAWLTGLALLAGLRRRRPPPPPRRRGWPSRSSRLVGRS